jgi:transposase-like protein
MIIDQLREQIPDEASCRKFFEKLIWPTGRICPHCGHNKSYRLSGTTTRTGLYECAYCKGQFTVTTKTPMHSTKLPLWKWLLAIYFTLNSSKGISSVFMARLIGVHQSTAWKMGHSIRQMMQCWTAELPPLKGIIEMDEKFFGGKPRHHYGRRHKSGKATKKQRILVTLQRQGPVYPLPVEGVKKATIMPVIEQVTDPQASLMTDESYVFQHAGKQFSSHQTVYHLAKEYARGDVHINTAESFGSMLERTKNGVYHHMSKKHLSRYLNELSFRWSNRDAKKITTKNGKKKITWSPKPIMQQLQTLMPYALGTQLRSTRSGGIRQIQKQILFPNLAFVL